MATVDVEELRRNIDLLIALARGGGDVIVSIDGIPAVRLTAIEPPLKHSLTRADLLTLPQSDPGLRDDLVSLAGDTTDDLGAIE